MMPRSQLAVEIIFSNFPLRQSSLYPSSSPADCLSRLAARQSTPSKSAFNASLYFTEEDLYEPRTLMILVVHF